MTFWNWRRGTGAATSGSAAMAMAPDLAPIELYTADSRIVGWIAANGRRVTDLLNAQDELRLWHPSPGPIEAPAVPTSANDPAPDTDETGEWQSLLTEQVILAMPPEWRASRQLRLHRKLRRVALTAGPFSVTGNLHVVPGAEPGPDLLSQWTALPAADGGVPAAQRRAALRARGQRGHRQHGPRHRSWSRSSPSPDPRRG